MQEEEKEGEEHPLCASIAGEHPLRGSIAAPSGALQKEREKPEEVEELVVVEAEEEQSDQKKKKRKRKKKKGEEEGGGGVDGGGRGGRQGLPGALRRTKAGSFCFAISRRSRGERVGTYADGCCRMLTYAAVR
jgi:hypothetical protein